jgi:hypothetical protein
MSTRPTSAVPGFGGPANGTGQGTWRVARFTPGDSSWRLVVAPEARDLGVASVVLTGRSSGTQVTLATRPDQGTHVADVLAADFRVFGPEVVDVWVDVTADGGTARRHRVSCADSPSIGLQAATAPGLRWYVTVKGNLSVEIAPPVSGRHLRPTLVDASAEADEWHLVVEGAGAHTEPILTARGRRSGVTVEFPLLASVAGWKATIPRERLKVLDSDVVDFHVVDRRGAGARSRLVAGMELAGLGRSDLRTWYATVDSNVSIRRKTAVEAIRDAGAFDAAFYRAQVPDLAPDEDAIEHYVTVGAAQGLDPSSMFDTAYYLRMNPGIRRMNPFAHYCEYGWKELRNPSARFDTWWYWSKHLDLADETVIPLAHYESVGKREGLSTRPARFPSRRMGTGFQFEEGQAVTRVCLFAAYDVDGIVDDYVVAYLSELARFADVYYLADGEMSATELAKLDGIVKGAWAERHGEYDFGSFKRLAERVGWDTLEGYDELVLANDSCYLLRPLDEVFGAMDARACDWWGLQASTRRHTSRDPHRLPIVHESVDMLVDRVESRQSDYLHVSSYFAAYRQPVLRDPEFRRYLGSVTRQSEKSGVILKYEIGLSRWLVSHGHRFDTFVRDVYPYQPTYNGWYFRLLDQGFPLLKRQLLSVNPFGLRGLANWKERILAKVPEADVDLFARNLQRVVDPATLDLTLGRDTEVRDVQEAPPSSVVSPDEFRRADQRIHKDAALWVFPVDARTGAFTGNVRALFEAVKDVPSIRKAVLRRGGPVNADGLHVEVVQADSPEGQACALRAGTIVVDEELSAEVPFPVSGELHNVIRLGSGSPRRLLEVVDDARTATRRRDIQYRATVSSSKVETLAVTAASYPSTFHQVWNTGLPRADFVLMDEARLPSDMASELADLRALVAERKLLLWMPELENAGERPPVLTPADREALKSWLVTNGWVLGVRSAASAESSALLSELGESAVIDLGASRFTHPEMLYREAAALVSEHSSSFVDFLVTGRPLVSFAPRLASGEVERVDRALENSFPGAVATTAADLFAALDGIPDDGTDVAYEFKRRLFLDHLDDANAARAAERIRDLTEVYGVGKRFGERMA